MNGCCSYVLDSRGVIVIVLRFFFCDELCRFLCEFVKEFVFLGLFEYFVGVIGDLLY